MELAKGKIALTHPSEKPKVKANLAPASAASAASSDSKPAAKVAESKIVSVPSAERAANTEFQYSACKAWNPFQTDFCKNCGQKMGVTAAAIAA